MILAQFACEQLNSPDIARVDARALHYFKKENMKNFSNAVFFLVVTMGCQFTYAQTANVRIVGGGEFFKPDSATGAPNTTIGIHLEKKKVSIVGEGHVSLHTSNRADATSPGNVTYFDSEIDIDCVKVISNAGGVLEIVLSGQKSAGSQTSYVKRTTSDSQAYSTSAPISTTRDKIVGRLKIDRNTNKVERSDWTTGQEICAGTSVAGLNADAQALGGGVGDQSLHAFRQCENRSVFLAKAIQNLVPKCDDPRIGSAGYEFNLDRELRPANTITFR